MNGHDLDGARILVTGAAGFLGSHLCESLIRSGACVLGADNLSTGRLSNLSSLIDQRSFTFLLHDVTMPRRIAGTIDAIMHLASPAAPRDYLAMPQATLRAGALGTLNMTKTAQQKNATFLLASTSEVYGDPMEHPQKESYLGNVNPIGPRSVYDEAKRFAEAVTAQAGRAGQRVAVARIFNTYGPRMSDGDSRVVPTFIRQARARQPLTIAGNGTQTRSLCYVDDTVDGLIRLLTSGFAEPVNIGATNEVTVLELAKLIRDLCGSPSPIEFVDLPADDPRRRRPDITRAAQVLGWAPRVDLHDGLSRTLHWHLHQPVGVT
ncbi:dTDP-glucose 4,6-dehydratase [Sinosporangium album]|uniref:dTDP-glucose 4,6-dehydratase n=1 Tax=Sinosporangium album TaxID=504805 RepID=A0A1G8KYH8_9ACTN|nr:NAD-dependent epimerase/dehydratase family protein [Sinosporangium album]SDI48528.1 dTDP-glucose 4,6-dehydratase [Sinosporangium album]